MSPVGIPGDVVLGNAHNLWWKKLEKLELCMKVPWSLTDGGSLFQPEPHHYVVGHEELHKLVEVGLVLALQPILLHVQH